MGGARSMAKTKYEIKEVWEEGCLNTYIFKNGEKFEQILQDGWGDIYSPIDIIKKLVKELNNK